MTRKLGWGLFLLLALHLFFLANLRFTAWPEMVSYPYLFNNGFVLYTDFIYPYPPLLTLIIAGLYKIFGYRLAVLKIFAWVLLLANDLLVFQIVRKLTKRLLFPFLGLVFYVLFQPFLEGNQLWFDVVVVTPILLATYLMLQKKYLPAGLFVGIACLVKQTAGLYLLFGLLYLVLQKAKIKEIVSFLAGPIILGLVLLAWLVNQGILLPFVNWNLIYPFVYWSHFPGYVQMGLSTRQTLALGLLLAPLIAILAKGWRRILKDRRQLMLICFLIISLVMIYPRFSFFHFQTALAFLVILYGVVLAQVGVRHILPVGFCLILFIVVSLPVIGSDWGKEARFWGSGDLAFARIVSAGAASGQKIFLLGQQSAIYAFSGRLPPKPWTDNFGWYLEIPGVQEEILARWQENPPEFVYWVIPKDGNWFDLATYQPARITKWITDNYTRKEEVASGVWLWERKD